MPWWIDVRRLRVVRRDDGSKRLVHEGETSSTVVQEICSTARVPLGCRDDCQVPMTDAHECRERADMNLLDHD